MASAKKSWPLPWRFPGKTIGSLEHGRYNPSIILAFKLARYFNTTIEDIFIYEEDAT